MNISVISSLRVPLLAGILPLLLAILLAMTSVAMAEEGAAVAGASPIVTVFKTPSCGCCTLWAEHMQEHGYEVEVIMVAETQTVRQELGVPNQLASCHTATVGDYWLEGHVPAFLVDRLLQQGPADIKGISAPGMPLGSPGMEAPNASSYTVVSYDDEGRVGKFATVPGETSR